MPNPRTDAESDAEPDSESDAEPDVESHAKPDVESHAKPDVCTDQLHCLGVGPMVGLQPAVRRRIPETQSSGSHRRPVWRRLPGGERFV